MIRAVLPLLICAVLCGLAAAGALLAFLADDSFVTLLASCVLGAMAFVTALKWRSADRALADLRSARPDSTLAPEPAQDLQ